VLLRPFLNDAGSCASYLFGCTSQSQLAVVDPHADLYEDYLAAAAAIGSPILAVFETHVQADHVSGLPLLVESTGATPYCPPEPASTSSTWPLPTVTPLSWGTRSSLRSRHLATLQPTSRIRSPTGGAAAPSPGSSLRATTPRRSVC
jgi:glyoxylase-like metal-dependent hydrolase (beta-lactamase superfamily II)